MVSCPDDCDSNSGRNPAPRREPLDMRLPEADQLFPVGVRDGGAILRIGEADVLEPVKGGGRADGDCHGGADDCLVHAGVAPVQEEQRAAAVPPEPSHRIQRLLVLPPPACPRLLAPAHPRLLSLPRPQLV